MPDGKNSALNYLDILVNHKQKNKEDRDIYLVVNGSGFNLGQIEELENQLRKSKVDGVYIVDLYQYDWSAIDQGWKIDDKPISIKGYYKDMYSMKDEERTYFAIKIDTFRLIALALLEQFTKQKGGIYVDFDTLRAIDGHIGKDITIPEEILLGYVNPILSNDGKIVDTYLNNDLIAINDTKIISDILSKYKGKILNQKEMCNQIKERLCSIVENEQFYETLKQQFYVDFRTRIQNIHNDGSNILNLSNIGMSEVNNILSKYVIKEFTVDVAKHRLLLIVENKKVCDAFCDKKKQQLNTKIKACIERFENQGIRALYDQRNFECFNFRISPDDTTEINLSQDSITSIVHNRLINKEADKKKLFSFKDNNGNYNVDAKNDCSWMKENLLYSSDRAASQLKSVASTSSTVQGINLV